MPLPPPPPPPTATTLTLVTPTGATQLKVPAVVYACCPVTPIFVVVVKLYLRAPNPTDPV